MFLTFFPNLRKSECSFIIIATLNIAMSCSNRFNYIFRNTILRHCGRSLSLCHGCGLSVCRGCIVRRLSSGARACPVCNVAASPPLLPDTRLQRLVYLAVPGLFRSELKRRRHFRLVNPQCPPLAPPMGALELTLEDFVSLSLRELRDVEERMPKKGRDLSRNEVSAGDRVGTGGSTRYLKCPAAVTVRHLARLLMLKRGWEEANATVNGVNNRIEIMYRKDETQYPGEESMRPLNPFWTLLDLACIFRWNRVSLMVRFDVNRG